MTVSRTGAQALVDSLLAHGADTGFGVPGESYLQVLDALHDVENRFRLVTCRQEGGAAYMAEAWGKLTGRPGICFVTRGPGATNASIGVHTAFQDSTPMILFVGQIARSATDREAFQEVDYRQMFGSLAKWVAQIEDARRIPEYVSHAFHAATSGRPGPVVLALPEDMLDDACMQAPTQSWRRVAASPSPAAMEELRQRLRGAQRPLVIVGGGGWTAAACADLQQFAERWALPVACAFRHQDLFDNLHPLYAGDVGLGIRPTLAARVREADLILAIGPRLGEATTSGYTLFDVPRPRQALVHVQPGADELGRVYAADLPILAGMQEFCAAAAAMPGFAGPEDSAPTTSQVDLGQDATPPWREAAAAAHAQWLDWNTPPVGAEPSGAPAMDSLMTMLRARLPADAIVANGAGNYSIWVHRYLQWRQFATQLGPTNGSMGYGVPAAIAAAVAHPDRTVVAFAGDGCFLMNGQEMATAVRERARIRVIVVDNGMYGTIRMHQEKHFPGRVFGSSLGQPDFAMLARAYGAWGERVEREDQLETALDRMMAVDGPALLHLLVDPEIITPTATITQLRKASGGG